MTNSCHIPLCILRYHKTKGDPKMHKITFEHSPSYQLSEKLAALLWNEVMTWQDFAKESVGKELIESADNVGAKIAAAYGQSTEKDQFFYLRLSNSALFETRHWLRLAYKRNLLSAECANSLKTVLDELSTKLNESLLQLKKAA